MRNDKKALGRGLSALIEDNFINFNNDSSNHENVDNSVVKVGVGEISPNPYQPRKFFNEKDLIELSDSIKYHGILQPILLRKAPDGIGYEIVAGERRWRASSRAYLDKVPAIILDLSNQQMMEYAILENIQRKDLNAIEEAEGFERLSEEFGYTQEMLASKLGKSRSYIANSLRLLQLPYDIKERVILGDISVGHARALVGKENASELAQRIVDDKLNVRQVEKLIKNPNADVSIQSSKAVNISLENQIKDPDLMEIEKALSDSLGMKVTINDTNQGGFVSIEFISLQQLDLIIQRLSNAGGLNF
ncbi:MAG: ParB/RepB/Spo0J family partition protein [Alphaproteobacteria bacterium]|jgi:ParB family chromosome partitioning protein|nr:ParB/RepB/Spo0J family partition protein [Candidatus Jidaibacter sp.]